MFSRLGGAVIALTLTTSAFALSAAPAHAVGDKDCADFDSQRQAQIFFLNHGGPDNDPHRLDDDGDGIACESNPAPYYYGDTPPDSNPQPTTVASRVALGINRSSAIHGESARLTAAVSPRGVRTVVFQRRLDGRWRAIERVTTGTLGKATVRVRAPRTSTKYRALVLAKKTETKHFKADASDARALRVLRQRVELSLSRETVAQGGSVTARVAARPVRNGRPVALQLYRQGSWDTVRTGSQNSRGAARFQVPTSITGTHRIRALVLRFRGAATARSNNERLTVRDVTAPDVPTDVAATAGDSTALVTWTPVDGEDLAHYEVYVRSTGSSWTLLGITSDVEWAATGLTNGVTYEFAVTSVDEYGNASDLSAPASATPGTPVFAVR
jgi:hypothetical protein